MYVLDFISLCNENINVKLVDETGETVSEYNGKDSIDPKYNYKKIHIISCCNDTIYLYI